MELIEENADVLRSLGYDPAGPATPRLVDFNLVLPNDAARMQAISFVRQMGYRCELWANPVDPDRPEAVASKILVPTAAAITEAEVALNDRLAELGGRTDGWGFFGETEH